MNENPSSRHLQDLPPRQINLFTKATVLFDGFMQQFGWVFFCMGSLFAWIFISASEVKYWFEPSKDWQETPGKVVSAEPTNSAVNDQVVYRYLHSFELDGQRFTGKSFTAGQQYNGGEAVTIRYDAKNPGDSYMLGTDRAVFPAFVLFVLLFPLIGGAFIIYAIRQNLKTIKLLEIGEFTRGRLVSKVATNVKINDSPVFKYEFGFEANGKQHIAICKTHQTGLVEDEEREIILYDRYNPGHNIVFDAESVPAITEQGELEPAPFWKIALILLPILGLAIQFYFILYPPNLVE